jgi:hypothetical protein
MRITTSDSEEDRQTRIGKHWAELRDPPYPQPLSGALIFTDESGAGHRGCE